jgi:hypothetical protein
MGRFVGAKRGFLAWVKRFVAGVVWKTQWYKVALSLMDSWLARR